MKRLSRFVTSLIVHDYCALSTSSRSLFKNFQDIDCYSNCSSDSINQQEQLPLMYRIIKEFIIKFVIYSLRQHSMSSNKVVSFIEQEGH